MRLLISSIFIVAVVLGVVACDVGVGPYGDARQITVVGTEFQFDPSQITVR